MVDCLSWAGDRKPCAVLSFIKVETGVRGAYNPQIGPPLISVGEAVSQLLEKLNSHPAPPDPDLTTNSTLSIR
jgi:hypothetical protein